MFKIKDEKKKEIARTVRELLLLKLKGFKQEIFSLRAENSVQEAFDIMKGKNIGAIIILDDESHVQGIFTERDIMKKCYIDKKMIDLKNIPMAEVMTKKVHTVSPNDFLSKCLFIFLANNVRHLPVIDEQKKIVGMLSIKDILDDTLDLYIDTLKKREN